MISVRQRRAANKGSIETLGDNHHPTWSPERDNFVLTHDNLRSKPDPIRRVDLR